MEDKILRYKEIKWMKVSRSTEKLPVFCVLLILTCFACKKSDKTVTVCLHNKSGHPVHFWTYYSYGGHLTNFYNDPCNFEVEPGSYFNWIADYPTIDPSGGRTGSLMAWMGSFYVGNEDIKFEFTDQSGALMYDFRDSLVGNFTFDCKLIELLPLNQSNLIWADTLSGNISKNSFLNQINIEIDTFYNGIAVFGVYPSVYEFSDGHIGGIESIGQDEVEIKTTYTSGNQLVQKICRGKKI